MSLYGMRHATANLLTRLGAASSGRRCRGRDWESVRGSGGGRWGRGNRDIQGYSLAVYEAQIDIRPMALFYASFISPRHLTHRVICLAFLNQPIDGKGNLSVL